MIPCHTIVKGIIPAAGLGTRMMKISGDVPKEMLPVGPRPMIARPIAELVDIGIVDIAVVVHPEKIVIAEYIRKVLQPELKRRGTAVNFHFIDQMDRRGLAHAIYLAKDFIDRQPFAVFLPDNYVRIPSGSTPKDIYRPLVDLLFEKNVHTVAVQKITSESVANRFGNCGKIEECTWIGPSTCRIDRIMRKKPGRLSLCGASAIYTMVARHFYLPDIFDAIEMLMQDRTLPEYDDTPIIGQMAAARRLFGIVCDCRMHDVGNPRGYAAAVAAETRQDRIRNAGRIDEP